MVVIGADRAVRSSSSPLDCCCWWGWDVTDVVDRVVLRLEEKLPCRKHDLKFARDCKVVGEE